MVKPKSKNISLGTIYRNLAQLVDENMIRELNFNGISHYDGNMSPHQHFVCNECDSIIDCHVKNDSTIDNIKKENNFDIKEVNIVFSGYCQNCKLS